MKTSQNGIDLIKQFEGCRLEAYKCPSGVWTIGYGHTANVKFNHKITIQQAEDFLIKDLAIFEKAVNQMITAKLNQNQFDALVSFVYNIGIGAFRASTLRRRLNAELYDDVPAQLMRWIYGNGNIKLEGLIRRRKAESNLFIK